MQGQFSTALCLCKMIVEKNVFFKSNAAVLKVIFIRYEKRHLFKQVHEIQKSRFHHVCGWKNKSELKFDLKA